MSLPTQFVSIVIPVLNEAKIIEDCLNSVTYQDEGEGWEDFLA